MTCSLCARHRARHGELAEQAARLLADERPDVRMDDRKNGKLTE